MIEMPYKVFYGYQELKRRRRGSSNRALNNCLEITRTAKGKTETSTVEVDVMDSDGQKYQIEYERRPKKGSRFVRAKNVENGQVKVFKGEQAERILKGIDLREGKVLKASKLNIKSNL